MQGLTAPDEPLLTKGLAFLGGKVEMINGKATAYVCENYTCKLPTSDPQVLYANIK